MKQTLLVLLSSVFLFSSTYAREEQTTPLSAEEEISLSDVERLFEIILPDEILDLDEDLEIAQAPAETESTFLSLDTKQESQNTAQMAKSIDSSSMILFGDEGKSVIAATASEQKNTPSMLPIKINFEQVFRGSPFIYSLLLLMSVTALFIWLYSQIHLRSVAEVPTGLPKNLKNKLTSNQYDEALALCLEHDGVYAKMIASGITTRRHGLQAMLETMKSEGRRASVKFWQRIALLNDIAIIAPMIGLLGTVLGMFYAFYDINRSSESITSLFDGLGISVGTTVAGLIVAIMSMILYSLARYRLVRRLALIEHEANSLAALIDNRFTH